MDTIPRPLTEQLFEQLTQDDRWIRDIAHPTSCYDSGRRFKHLSTCSWPVSYIVTEAQRDRALGMEAARRAELLSGITAGELVFVSMGGEAPTGVGNHRLWTRFLNDAGREYHVEISLSADGSCYYVGFAIDKALEADYERRVDETCRWNASNPICLHRRLPDQNHFLSPKAVEGDIGTRWEDVLSFFNHSFGASYRSARRIDHFVGVEDYLCRPEGISEQF